MLSERSEVLRVSLNRKFLKKLIMEETKSFAEMLEETNLTPKRFDPGEKTDAIVVKISPEWIFIDLGAKSEGYLDKNEFSMIRAI